MKSKKKEKKEKKDVLGALVSSYQKVWRNRPPLTNLITRLIIDIETMTGQANQHSITLVLGKASTLHPPVQFLVRSHDPVFWGKRLLGVQSTYHFKPLRFTQLCTSSRRRLTFSCKSTGLSPMIITLASSA